MKTGTTRAAIAPRLAALASCHKQNEFSDVRAKQGGWFVRSVHLLRERTDVCDRLLRSTCEIKSKRVDKHNIYFLHVCVYGVHMYSMYDDNDDDDDDNDDGFLW